MRRRSGLGRWPLRRAVVRGPSMSPALRDGDVVLVVAGDRPRPGSVVLVRWPSRPGQLSVKRVVGRHGRGWWVLGDNPRGSTDSRQLGAAEVLGTVPLRLWPTPRRLRR
ncbi:MAG: nickel-type superoxide dismutase maturation protease [Pseudonocardiaceae bacterium]